MSWVREFLRKEPGDSFFGPVQSPEGMVPDAPLEPESGYLALYLESMRISAARIRGQTFYGAVAATCKVAARSGGQAELIAVSTPESLRGADPAHLDRVVTGTIPLVDAVPYRGGGVDAEIGLFAIPGNYLTGPYLDLLSEVAAVASAFLPPAGALASTALTGPVRKGLDLLLGATAGTRLEIGLAHTWPKPVPGYYAVARAAEPPGGFRIDSGHHLTNKDGSDVRVPYMVLRLDAQRERHNWAEIPDISAAYQAVADAARRGDLVAAKEALASFHRVAVFSSDLLTADGQRLHRKVAEQTRLAFPATATSGTPKPKAFPNLTDIQLYEKS